ncbi:hypothetical protein K439DRAFT_1527195 [Ramaria rubella]|nr:hypothetical protein K439DRAFT_1527195 [Ramaria rubella]
MAYRWQEAARGAERWRVGGKREGGRALSATEGIQVCWGNAKGVGVTQKGWQGVQGHCRGHAGMGATQMGWWGVDGGHRGHAGQEDDGGGERAVGPAIGQWGWQEGDGGGKRVVEVAIGWWRWQEGGGGGPLFGCAPPPECTNVAAYAQSQVDGGPVEGPLVWMWSAWSLQVVVVHVGGMDVVLVLGGMTPSTLTASWPPGGLCVLCRMVTPSLAMAWPAQSHD